MIKNDTKHKRNEAYHFLSMMKQTFEDDDTFSYNLSAFLSAARSITEYMQKQYAYRDGFPEWYCASQTKMKADEELSYLNKARVEDVHKEYVRTVATRLKNFTIDVCLVEQSGAGASANRSEPASMPQEQSSPRTIRRNFAKFNNTDVLEFCEKQLLKLTRIVEECETKFPTKQ